MASRYDILLGKPIPEVIYTEPKDFWKTGMKIFSNTKKISDNEHKCRLKKTYATQGSEGFICFCDKLWKYLNFSTLKEWEDKTEILNKKKEQRIKKGFTKK
jgi:DNA-directed RNA polymerase delta subunit